jgi:uncharacterized protein YmfQ (DUF2313 family)
MRFPQQFPTGEETFNLFARELLSLLGYSAPNGSLLAEDARVLGQALGDAWEALDDAGKENFVTLATQLLSEWEARTGTPISPGSSNADRQSALTAKRRATGGNTRGRVLAAAQAFDGTASIVTTAATAAAAASDERKVFEWGVAVTASAYNLWKELLRAILEQLKPAHTKCTLGTLGDGGYFRTDDADSLTDQTLLGG